MEADTGVMAYLVIMDTIYQVRNTSHVEKMRFTIPSYLWWDINKIVIRGITGRFVRYIMKRI